MKTEKCESTDDDGEVASLAAHRAAQDEPVLCEMIEDAFGNLFMRSRSSGSEPWSAWMEFSLD